jgi:hypothetical protein
MTPSGIEPRTPRQPLLFNNIHGTHCCVFYGNNSYANALHYNYTAYLVYKCACSWNKHINTRSAYLAVCRVRQEAGCYKKQSRYRRGHAQVSLIQRVTWSWLSLLLKYYSPSWTLASNTTRPWSLYACLCHILTTFRPSSASSDNPAILSLCSLPTCPQHLNLFDFMNFTVSAPCRTPCISLLVLYSPASFFFFFNRTISLNNLPSAYFKIISYISSDVMSRFRPPRAQVYQPKSLVASEGY